MDTDWRRAPNQAFVVGPAALLGYAAAYKAGQCIVQDDARPDKKYRRQNGVQLSAFLQVPLAKCAGCFKEGAGYRTNEICFVMCAQQNKMCGDGLTIRSRHAAVTHCKKSSSACVHPCRRVGRAVQSAPTTKQKMSNCVCMCTSFPYNSPIHCRRIHRRKVTQ